MEIKTENINTFIIVWTIVCIFCFGIGIMIGTINTTDKLSGVLQQSQEKLSECEGQLSLCEGKLEFYSGVRAK